MVLVVLPLTSLLWGVLKGYNGNWDLPFFTGEIGI